MTKPKIVAKTDTDYENGSTFHRYGYCLPEHTSAPDSWLRLTISTMHYK